MNHYTSSFAIAIEKFFSVRADWHQDDRVRPLVRQYQTALNSVLQSHPELRGCAAYCMDCGIRFLTHPRNAGRRNLRCPFGCREHHRRAQSCQRSTAYYQTAAGKAKKKRLNGRRHGSQVPPAAPPDLDFPESPPDAQVEVPLGGAPSPMTIEARPQCAVLDESSLARSPMLPYVRMVVSLIEGIRFTCREVLDLLLQALRQHRIGALSGRDYLRGVVSPHPP